MGFLSPRRSGPPCPVPQEKVLNVPHALCFYSRTPNTEHRTPSLPTLACEACWLHSRTCPTAPFTPAPASLAFLQLCKPQAQSGIWAFALSLPSAWNTPLVVYPSCSSSLCSDAASLTPTPPHPTLTPCLLTLLCFSKHSSPPEVIVMMSTSMICEARALSTGSSWNDQ